MQSDQDMSTAGDQDGGRSQRCGFFGCMNACHPFVVIGFIIFVFCFVVVLCCHESLVCVCPCVCVCVYVCVRACACMYACM